MKKELICKTGIIESISETIEIPNKVDESVRLIKKNVVISFRDGQRGLFEARRREIQHMNRLGIEEGSRVEVNFALKLSETKGKAYNNLRIFRIFKKDD